MAKASAKKAAKSTRKKAAPVAEVAPEPPTPAPAPTPASPRFAPVPAAPDSGASALAWLALGLAVLPAFAQLMFLAYGDGRWDNSDFFLVPATALLLPSLAAILAAVALSGRNGHAVQDGARTAALIALVLGIAVVATWGLWILLAMLFLATWHPSPQPCNFSCQASGNPTCGNNCGSEPHSGGCCDPGSCCEPRKASSDGGSCCGSSSQSGSGGGGGSCCGSSSKSDSGGSSGSCCGSSSSSGSGGGGGGGGGSGKPASAGGLVSVGAGLAGALALRRVNWSAALAHHPDTAAYKEDVFRVAGLRLCVGCTTTFPLFLLLTPILATTGLPGPWWAPLAAGLALASTQVISAAGLARRRATKFAVKAALGVGLALAVVALREAPWSPLLRGLAMLALASLAFASTLPRRRRMARAAQQL